MAEVLTKSSESWSDAPAIEFGSDTPILKEIMRHGYARVDMTTSLACAALNGMSGEQVINAVHAESNDLFARTDLDDFVRKEDEPFCYAGVRKPSVAKLEVAEQPDLNRSILAYPFDKLGERCIPNADRIQPFLNALGDYAIMSALITEQIMQELAEEYNHPFALKFKRASVAQANHYNIETMEKDAWQQPIHQDVNWITILAADKPGLYGLDPSVQKWPQHARDLDTVSYSHKDYEKHLAPLRLKPGHVLVMGGSILSAATGGRIRPFYHSPRNEYDKRNSAMYFVSPDLDQEIPLLEPNWFNEGVDLRHMTATQPATYGLGEFFVPGSREYYDTLAHQ